MCFLLSPCYESLSRVFLFVQLLLTNDERHVSRHAAAVAICVWLSLRRDRSMTKTLPQSQLPEQSLICFTDSEATSTIVTYWQVIGDVASHEETKIKKGSS